MAEPSQDRREFPRYDTDVSAILASRTMKIRVRMLSVSASGALVRMDRLHAKVFGDDRFTLEITGIGRFSAARKWRRDTDIGAMFVLSDPDRRRLAERLEDRFGRRDPWLSRLAASPT